MIKPSEQSLLAQQEKDLKQGELFRKYDQDLRMINRCKEELDNVSARRTFQYEQDLLAIDREYEERVSRFDMRNEEQSLARQEAEVDNG